MKDLKKIGRGGYGAVYSASLGREKVAVKMLSDDALSTGFDQEVSLMAQCSSIYIAQIKGACYSPPSCCIIMELMQQDLKTYLQKWKFQKDGSPIKIRYQIACDIACGIEYLHEKGILHNDVKSPNVLLDGSLRGKVTDFGASRKKVSESVSVGAGGLVGTVCWMAPEVERGGGCGRFSDMFSVGMVLWELVSFETPFVKMTPLEYLNMVNHGEKREHIPVSTPFAPVPPMYFEMINECWRVDPTKRPSATRLVDELLKEFSTL
uniref:Protein kinase domain-containing protein n=2 Tax=Arcella intermedia TaxID=1963864 RepID=A0A6B2LDN0_9EUKA